MGGAARANGPLLERPREGSLAIALFLLALLVRWLYVWELWRSPAIHLLSVDSLAYHERALEILAGGWLGDRVFYQDPLYPYFLAGLYGLFGAQSPGVLLAQAALGAASAALIFAMASRAFGRAAGCAAGLLAALYGPLVYYDGLILKATLSVFLACLALFLLVRAWQRPGPGWLFAGLALGLACLTRGNYLIALLPILVWAGLVSGGRRPAVLAIGALALGLALAILPVTLRNRVVGGEWVLITSQAGQNFYIGNFRGNATGTYKAPAFVVAHPRREEAGFAAEARRRTGRDLAPGQLSRYWFGQALLEIRRDPTHFLRHALVKTRLFANDYEVPDNQSYDFFRLHVSRLLALPLPGYGLLLPLAACGAFLARRNPGAWLLLAYFASYGASNVLFFTTSRYRIPVAPAVIALAGLALVELLRAARLRKSGALAGTSLALVVGWLATHQPVSRLDFSTQHYNVGQHLARRAHEREALGDERARAGDSEGATAAWREAASLRERAERQLRLGLEIRPGHRALETALRRVLVARVLEAERHDGADEAVARARALVAAYPEFADGHWHLGANLARSGRSDLARLSLQRALELRPGHAEARAELARLRGGERAPREVR